MRKALAGIGIGVFVIGLILSIIIVNNGIAGGMYLEYYGGFLPFLQLVLSFPLFIIGAIVGVLFIIMGFVAGKTSSGNAATAPVEKTVIKETIREIVKVKCPFCGALVDHLLSTCPQCAGNLK